MPLQNRVAPDGSLHAVAARGTLMGNRGGCFHHPDRSLRARPWASRRWIACRLAFKGRRRQVFQPGRYTELFFLDEATALAAGHRPCFECRRADAARFQALWAVVHGLAEPPAVAAIDARLHADRIAGRSSKRTVAVPCCDLPAGAMVQHAGQSWLVTAQGLAPWSFAGYGESVSATAAVEVELLTPPSIVAIIRAGYAPMLHPSVSAH
jgi:hypothetical protein